MTNEPVKVTASGLERMRAQLEYLQTTRREQISEYMGKAIEDGDLRESAAYDEARMQQSENEARIAELESQIGRAVVISDDEIDENAINVGATVLVRSDAGMERSFEIVGGFEVDVLRGKISDASPLGQQLMGKRAGDTVELQGPRGGVNKFTVISVRYE